MNQNPVSSNQLTLKVGKWLEASASGPMAIGALVALVVGLAVLRGIGWL